MKQEEWYFIRDHDASFGHYHLCPVCGKESPTTSRICPGHDIYYVTRQSHLDDYIVNKLPVKAKGEE